MLDETGPSSDTETGLPSDVVSDAVVEASDAKADASVKGDASDESSSLAAMICGS